jgi:hypothetical protein
LSRRRSVSRSALRAGSGELGEIELRTHTHRGETAAALALEVVDDGVTRNRDGEPPAAVATAAGDDGLGVAGLDVRRKGGAEARRNGAGARASVRRQVASGLERSEHGVAVDGVGGRRAALIADGSRAM